MRVKELSEWMHACGTQDQSKADLTPSHVKEGFTLESSFTHAYVRFIHLHV
jgi:hypothetical protein